MLWFLPQLPGRKKIHCSCTPRFILKRFAKRQLLHFWMIFLHEFTTVTGIIAISWEWPWRCASLKKDKKRNQILGQRILKLKKDLCRSGPAPFWRRHVLPSASINPNPKCQTGEKHCVTLSDPHPYTLFLHSFWQSGSIYGIYILTFYLTFFLAYTLTSYLTFYLASILAFLLAFYVASILTFYLSFSLTWTLRLRSGSAHWHLALEGLRSGSAHWDQLAVEVRQCPLRSGACTMGPGEQLLSVLVFPSTIGWMHLLPEEQAFYNTPRYWLQDVWAYSTV